jgi:hypothetical protein
MKKDRIIAEKKKIPYYSSENFTPYTVKKKVGDFPVLSGDVTYQTLQKAGK